VTGYLTCPCCEYRAARVNIEDKVEKHNGRIRRLNALASGLDKIVSRLRQTDGSMTPTAVESIAKAIRKELE